jgi:hypothetical protein
MCGEPAISLYSHHVSLVQWTTLLPVTRDPDSRSGCWGGALWRACNLTAFSPCLTGPLDYPFASCHKGPGFKSPGGYLFGTGILLLPMSRYIYIYLFQLHLETIRNKIIPLFNFIEANILCYPTYSTCRKIKQVQNV